MVQPENGAIGHTPQNLVSHLDRRILVDHAWVRGLTAWEPKAFLLQMPDEDDPAKRFSDHRPLVVELTIP